MGVDKEAALRKARKLREVIETGQSIFNGNDPIKEFDAACDHVVQLLRDSLLLFNLKSFATSLFLSITALEEKTKVEVSIFKYRESSTARNRKGDPLFSHKQKHAIALQEVLLIGGRLETAIGEKRVRDLLNMAERGGFVKLRESALYLDRGDTGLKLPEATIDMETARAVLLLAIEAAHDSFTGGTNKSWELGNELDSMFTQMCDS